MRTLASSALAIIAAWMLAACASAITLLGRSRFLCKSGTASDDDDGFCSADCFGVPNGGAKVDVCGVWCVAVLNGKIPSLHRCLFSRANALA